MKTQYFHLIDFIIKERLSEEKFRVFQHTALEDSKIYEMFSFDLMNRDK